MNDLEQFSAQFGDITLPTKDMYELGRQWYLLNKDAKAAMQTISDEPVSAGLLLGEVKQKKFSPAIPLLNIIGKQTSQKVSLDEDTAYLFICGRDIFPATISEQTRDINLSAPFIVTNEKDEVLGYAKKGKDKSNRTVYTNLLDIGNYLRKEKS